MKKLYKLLLIGKLRRELLLKAIFWVLFIQVLLYFVSFKRVVKFVETISKNDRYLSDDTSILKDIIWSIHTVDKYLIRKNNCLIRSLLARILLGRYGIPSDLQIGVKRDKNGNFIAHAWVEYKGKSIFKERDVIEFKKFSHL